MKYTKEERLDIGRRIYTGEMSRYEASEKYDININTARDYMRLYRDTHDLPAKRGTPKNYAVGQTAASAASLEELESMSKEELIRELIKATEMFLGEELADAIFSCPSSFGGYQKLDTAAFFS